MSAMKRLISEGKIPAFIKKLLTLALALVICVQSVQLSFAASPVLVGKDGWLFYTGDDTLKDYNGTDLLSMAQLEKLKNHLEVFSSELAMQGCEFVVFIAPNKEQIYAEYMPDSYGQPASYTRAQQVYDYLTYSGFRVVYPIEEFREVVAAHPEYSFYYMQDTHWNSLGAYIGARALLAELGIEWPAIEELSIEPNLITSGDLASMLGTNAFNIDYNLSGYTDHPLLMADFSSSSVTRFWNAGADERKLMVVGDSFSNALSGYLASAFNEVVVSHDRTRYKPSLLTNEQPDIYVYEIVERYLGMMNSDNGLFTEADLR